MAWRAGGGCKSFLCVLVFFVAVCSFSHCTEPARSQTSNSVKLKGHGTFSQNHSKADSSGRLIIGRSPLKGAILKEVKFANNPLDYQSDPAWEAPAHVYGTASYDRASAQKLLQMNPKVECTPEAMKLMVLDPGSTPGSLFVDRGSLLAPLPLSKLPTSCGYSLTSARRHLILVAPYDGCFVTQEDDCYVLPLQWCGLPVRMSCPAVKQSNPPVVSCRAEGMVVTMEWIVSVSDIKVKLNDQWEPLMKVSSTCGFSVVAHSEGVVISARYAPCVQMKDGMFTFGLSGNGEIKVACPPQLKPAQSPNQQVPSSPWSLHPVPPTLAPPFNQFPLYPWLLQPPVTKPHKTHQVDQPDQSKPDGLPLIPDEKPVQHKPAILSPVTHAPRGPEQQPIYPYPLSTQQPTYEYEYPPDFSPEPTTEPPVINPPEMHGPPVTTPPKMPFYFPQTPPVNENPGEMYFDFSPEPTTEPPVTEPPVINPPEMPFYFPQAPPVNENPGGMYFDFSPEPTTEPPVINPPEMPFYFPQTPPVNENPGEMYFDFSPEPTTEPPVINPPEMPFYFPQTPPVNENPGEMYFDFSPEPTTEPPVINPPEMPFHFRQTPPVNENPGEMYFDFSPEPTTEPPVINPPEMPFYFPQTPPVNGNPGEMQFDFSPEPTTEPPVINPPEMPFYFPQTPPVNENPGEMQFDFSPEPTTEPPVINPPEMHGDFSQPPQITADSDTQTPQSGITYNSPVLCPENCISGFSHCCPSISFHQHYHYSVCPGGSQHEAPPYQPKDQPQAAVNTILKLYNQFYDLQPKVLYGESSDVNDHTETKPIYYNTYDQQKDYFVQNDEPVEDLWLSASEHQHSYMQDFGGLPTSDDDDPSKTHKPVHRHNKSSQHEHPVDSNSEPDGYEGGKDKLFKSQPRASYPVPLPNEDDQLPINQELTESASLAYPVPNGHNSPTLTPKPSLSPSNTSLKPEPPESLKDERKSKTQLGSIPSVPPQVSGQPSQTQDSELEAYHQSKGQKRTN